MENNRGIWVQNASTLKQTISQQYKYRIELHAHTTPASVCSEIPPKQMVETYKDLGYDAITLTNHFVYSEKCSKAEYISELSGIFRTTGAESLFGYRNSLYRE